MIIEDSKKLSTLLEELLTEFNFEVKSLNDPQHFIKMAESFNPDLIISDVLMPNVSGFKLLEEAKNNELLKMKPIMFLSAKADETILNAAYKAGVNDYIIKPYRANELLERIKILIDE
jgi:DNA-binding response OmpR family regulator